MSKGVAKQMIHEGRFEEALQLLGQMCDCSGHEDAESWCIAGTLYGRKGEMNNAIRYLNEAVKLRPDYIDALFNLAKAYIAVGKLEKSCEALNKILALDGTHYHAWMSIAYVAGLRGESDNAYGIYRNLYRQYPHIREVGENLAKVSLQLGRFSEVEEVLVRLLGEGVEDVELFLMMGCVKQYLGMPISALEFYQKGLRIDKHSVPALMNSGICSLDAGLHQDAMNFFSSAISVNPDAPKAWHARLSAYNYFSEDHQKVFDVHKDWGQRKEEKVGRGKEKQEVFYSHHEKLHIGYMSPDFCAHSVAFFIEALLKNHDTARFDIFCYADVAKPDSVTDRLRNYSVSWVNICSLSDKDVVAQVRKDEIDILVDLSGHTAGNRLTVFAAKPAALQVSYLGYPNTTGLTTMDYRLTDELADPIGMADTLHTEKLYRLKDGFLCYTPPLNVSMPTCSKAISGNKIVFGSFNNISKITADVINVWSEILSRAPDSLMVFKHKVTCDENVRRRLLSMFGGNGVDARRIRFYPWTRYYDEHMAAYNSVHIALDTFPYNGTTTTFEALWMGVPVITLKGEVHAGRVGFSVLERIGVSGLVTNSKDAYVDLAVDLSCDLGRLSEISAGLRSRLASSVLCDGGRFARDVEVAYEQMWCEMGG